MLGHPLDAVQALCYIQALMGTITDDGAKSLADLWLTEAPGIRRHFQRELGSREDAEDLTARAFVRLAAVLEQGNATNPEAVLRLTAQSLLKNELRDRARKPSTQSWEQMTPEQRDQLAGKSFIDQGLATFTDRFDRVLRALDPDVRDAFILTELRGLSTREAGPLLGVSHMTALRRAECARKVIADNV